ncbi:isocitrate lyase/PEP mutase family protein [Sphingomonas fennica]|uniref:Isocitrate lyase/phosphoenolpyruvate mutase family protein n=1 Tax=Edaphosphingomonas fennica TaxID=114404 RepID=A0A2T4I033_9SPHN|nr:isocitrate lyase/phosphoenolpyruvate mutase family protein [Sphingomonas fennica]PTD22062.1 isocitrate lyase/phosphoenolpyruvate mutase family protein [Sphingomonas fennica]
MPTAADKARIFADLHVPGRPLQLFNIWDAGSARAVADAGAPALATGSWSVAAAHGLDDGEALPLTLVLANLERIVAAVDLPVTLDFEGGYGATADEVGRSAASAAGIGAIGFNIEDQQIGGNGLRPIGDQQARIAAMRAAAPHAFVNARTDIFLKAPAAAHDDAAIDDALVRAQAYADAGASGFFAPGLADERLIARLCERSPLPVNIMMFPAVPPAARLAELGVARISHGPGPYRLAMAAVTEAARALYP